MSRMARRLVALLLFVLLAGAGFALLRTGLYGLTIFVLMPMLPGGLASWAFRPASGANAAGLGALAAIAALSAMLLTGAEGLLCLAMALPLAVPLAALGSWLVWKAERSTFTTRSAPLLLFLPLVSVAPFSVRWDARAPQPVFEVRSAIEIAASPEQVWKHVVSFSELPEPREWYFRSGVAYPMRARIEGTGPGATRYCEFSTGPFVEPIEVWDEPRLLRFRVTENPAPLHEWSPYARVLPRHLHGYLVSKEGQFRLTRMANNRTLLEGTTWYRHGLWPAEYWRWWSDAIIHRIHMRVLTHIRTLAEAGARAW